MTGEPSEFRACWVCGRTILRGERVRSFLTPDAEVADVCALCVARAESGGWVPAEAGESALARVGERRGRSLKERLRSGGLSARMRPRQQPDEPPADEPEHIAGPSQLYEGSEEDLDDPLPPSSANGSDEEPEVEGSAAPEESDDLEGQRHRRVAVEAFNRSEARRKVAGLIRSLGSPAVSVRHLDDEDGRVLLTVAWELTWYQWEAKGEGSELSVAEVKRGQEVEELSEHTREWNARAGEDGRLRLGAVAAR